MSYNNQRNKDVNNLMQNTSNMSIWDTPDNDDRKNGRSDSSYVPPHRRDGGDGGFGRNDEYRRSDNKQEGYRSSGFQGAYASQSSSRDNFGYRPRDGGDRSDFGGNRGRNERDNFGYRSRDAGQSSGFRGREPSRDRGVENFPPAFIRPPRQPYGREGGFGERPQGSAAPTPSSNIPDPNFEWLPHNPPLEELLFGTAHVKTGINFDKYDEIPASAVGNNVPKPIHDFFQSDLHPLIKENVKLAQYSHPTPIQKYSIPIITSGRDLMACAQTGSGKTAAFLFPILSQLFKHAIRPVRTSGYQHTVYPIALILAPTRELAIQIYEESRKFCYRSWVIPQVCYGGQPIANQVRELSKGCDLLVATPGRLVDLINNRARVSLASIKFLVLDEADRMLDMGFEPQIRQIVEGSNMPPKTQRQTLMFSATFPKEIKLLAAEFLNDYVFVSIGRVGSTSENIRQQIVFVEEHEKRSYLMDLLRADASGLTLVFVETKRNCDNVDDFLYRAGFPSTSIHGDRTQPEREAALKSFRAGETPVLIATAVAARGLDIPNVTHVINYDLPTDIDDYVHRIGRTGRAGNIGRATSFFNDNNRNVAGGLIEILREAKQEVPQWLESIGPARFTAPGRAQAFGGQRRNNAGFGAPPNTRGFSRNVESSASSFGFSGSSGTRNRQDQGEWAGGSEWNQPPASNESQGYYGGMPRAADSWDS